MAIGNNNFLPIRFLCKWERNKEASLYVLSQSISIIQVRIEISILICSSKNPIFDGIINGLFEHHLSKIRATLLVARLDPIKLPNVNVTVYANVRGPFALYSFYFSIKSFKFL